MIDPAARGAWRDLDAKLRPFIASCVRAEPDVDDVVQDVFLRMQRGLAELRDDERFGPWVYQVARNAIADHQRAAVRHPLANGARPEEEVAPPEDEDAGAVERELAAYVAPFVTMLPSPYREALTLTALEGLTQKDAAAMLGISVSGMKSRVSTPRRPVPRGLLGLLKMRGQAAFCEPDNC